MVDELLRRRPHLRVCVSATTRPARPTEKHGVHYQFISEREFSALVDSGGFLEWAQVHGSLYGTPRKQVSDLLQQGHDVILEIDVQGAAQVKQRLPEAKLIFIEPPSMTVLEDRLKSRRTEQEEEQDRRRSAAHEELRKRDAFDAVIVNDVLERCVDEVLGIMDELKEKE